MSGVEGLPGGIAPAGGASGARPVGRAPVPTAAPPVSAVGQAPADRGGFDPVAAIVAVAQGAAAAPLTGLSGQLLDWAAPSARQFESLAPSRLLPLLSLATDRLASDAQRVDLLGDLGATALERELRDHLALAERRATMIEW